MQRPPKRIRTRRWLPAIPGLLCMLWMLAAPAPQASSAEPYSEASVKAAFLYRFAAYVEWPPVSQATPEFTIAVLGADEVAARLQVLLPNLAVRDRQAQVRKVAAVRDVGTAQILYVGPAHRGELRSIIAELSTRPVLMVTDDARGLEAGSAINFILVDRRVRFEVSLAAAQLAGLKISSELLAVATRVQGGRLRSDATCAMPCNVRVANE